ncbi:hypothetical protein BUALT_Bualt01G0174300 [Buddleja alternifolia]|uniref:PGG domain-containing protein n=1 Tax=Buddleja alternifolia TaxID=168488 RepID=A0AAV6YGF4_9LAMI|nr:hypothetical protein BUALT_Bualt01G0174300 [Buddleja alternifolia]
MLCLVESQDLLGFIDGETPPLPENAAAEEQKVWRRRDRLVKGWILGSVGEDALDAVVGLDTAMDVWLELEKIFSEKADESDNIDESQSSGTDSSEEEWEPSEVEVESSSPSAEHWHRRGEDWSEGDTDSSPPTPHGIPLKLSLSRSDNTRSIAIDVENHSINAPIVSNVRCDAMLWKVIKHLVPQVKGIADKKLIHQQALELVKCLCQKLESLPHQQASTIYNHSIILAARFGIHEVVEDELTEATVLRLSGLLWQQLNALVREIHKLNLVPGAALQMQREIQWFKEMEKFVRPSRRTWQNDDKKTPKMLFTEEHQQVKAEGEKWMKHTANSCTIATALIATIVFTAAFTVPGGVATENGMPIFRGNFAFILFAISDAISLFTSITSLLMFLSILTSRYAEEDFLYDLPKRLCIGLVTLFISITFMMAAFSATLYLVLVKENRWLLIPVAALACLPVTSFVLLQFPLVVDVMY